MTRLLKLYPYRTGFILAVSVRFLYALILYLMGGEEYFVTHGGDSILYTSMADEVIRHGGFLMSDAANGVVPQTERLPLYILLIAAMKWIFPATFWPAIILQILIDASACVLIARIAAFVNKAWTAPAVVIASLNPTQIVLSCVILSDSLFFFFACAAFVLLLSWWQKPGIVNAALVGLTIGFAIMTRELMLYWGLLVIPAIAISLVGRREKPVPSNTALGLMTVAMLFLILAMSPILARNYARFGVLDTTSQKGAHLSSWVLPLVWAVSGRVATHAEGARIAEELFAADPRFGPLEMATGNPFLKSRLRAEFAVRELAGSSWPDLLKAWGYGATLTLGTPVFVHIPPVSRLPRPGFYESKSAGLTDKIWNFLFHNPNRLYGIILLSGCAGVVVMRTLQLVGLVSWWRSGQGRAALWLAISWIVYVLAINGPVGSPKYRLPVEMVLTLFATAAIAKKLTAPLAS